MASEQIIDEIRKIADEINSRGPDHYLTRDRSGKGFICPICGSGSGKSGTGITSKRQCALYLLGRMLHKRRCYRHHRPSIWAYKWLG